MRRSSWLSDLVTCSVSSGLGMSPIENCDVLCRVRMADVSRLGDGPEKPPFSAVDKLYLPRLSFSDATKG
jgi:hypothetical protein